MMVSLVSNNKQVTLLLRQIDTGCQHNHTSHKKGITLRAKNP